MFLVSWAGMAQSKSISISVYPSFRRSLLSPRRPASSSDASISNLFVPISCIPPPPNYSKATTQDQNIIISRIYYMTAESITNLQAHASSSTCKRTKLEALCACLWQIVAKNEIEGTGKKCRIGVVVDGRGRMSNGIEPSSLSNYFGNVLSLPYGEERAEELRTRPLSWVADAVHESVRIAACKEHFLNLIDWVETRRPEPAVAKVYCTRMEEGAAFVVSSGQRFPVTKVDFRWGKPVFGSYHFPWGGETGYVMPMPSASREGDWVVYMHLAKAHLDLVEAELGHLFQPLTADYFNQLGCF